MNEFGIGRGIGIGKFGGGGFGLKLYLMEIVCGCFGVFIFWMIYGIDFACLRRLL